MAISSFADPVSARVWLIICELEDDSALSLATLLEREGVELTVLLPEDLVRATHVHHVRGDGASGFVRLRDGTELDLANVSLLVNRLFAVPEAHVERCAPEERAYVRAEWTAFFASLVSCCGGPVLNPPSGDNPGGHPLNELECLHYAGICGLPVAPRVVTDQADSWVEVEPPPLSSHIVVGESVLPELSEPLAQGARRLARVLGLPLLQVDFAADPEGHYVFHGCSSQVEFRLAPGAELVAALRRIADNRVAT